MTETVTPFNPSQHLRPMRGGAMYLDVKWRIVWLRREAPDSTIETELLSQSPTAALFRATVTRIVDGEVRGRGVGHGSETQGDFGDFIEKAETKAIGRALQHLGYGTAEAADDGDRIADSPVDQGPPPPRRTERQAEQVQQRVLVLGWSPAQVEAFCRRHFRAASPAALSEAQAQQAIRLLDAEVDAHIAADADDDRPH